MIVAISDEQIAFLKHWIRSDKGFIPQSFPTRSSLAPSCGQECLKQQNEPPYYDGVDSCCIIWDVSVYQVVIMLLWACIFGVWKNKIMVVYS